MKKTTKRMTAVAPRVKASVQAVWLAGLGALVSAGEESNKIFHQLVKRGEQAEKVGRGKINGRINKLVAKAEDLRDDANAAFGTRVRKPIDKGVATALHRLGVPTRSEILELTKRVEGLTRAVEKQHKKTRAPKTAASAV